MRRSEQFELPGLTSLRGLAALAVVLYHAGLMAHRLGATAPFVFSRGYLAVDLFFFLSGFVLTHVYAELLAVPTRTAILSFLWARFCRVYPTAVFSLLLIGTLCLMGLPLVPADALGRQLTAGLFLMQVPWLASVGPNDPAWSLSAELYAYLIFPAILPIAISTHRVVTIAIVLTAWIAWFHATFGMQVSGFPALLRALPEFMAGMVLYRLYRDRVFGRLFDRDFAFLVIAGAVIGSAIWLPEAAVVLFLPALLLASVSNEGRLRGLLSAAVIRWLGEISYSVYIFQMAPVILAVFAWPMLKDAGIGGTAVFEAIIIFSAIACGALVHRCVDHPARAALRGLHLFQGGVRSASAVVSPMR